MDKRQKKTRESIFRAFVELLSEQSLQSITVSDIIQKADVGRATFYAHFETKEFLLKSLCEELFCHVTDQMDGHAYHHHIFKCESSQSPVEHIFNHLQQNDNQMRKLLSGRNREVFLPYFQSGLKDFVSTWNQEFPLPQGLPKSYWDSHLAACFTQTLCWWLDNGMEQSPQQISAYFYLALSGK